MVLVSHVQLFKNILKHFKNIHFFIIFLYINVKIYVCICFPKSKITFKFGI